MDDLSEYKDLYAQEAEQYMTTLREYLSALSSESDPMHAIRAANLAAHSLKGISLTMGYDEPAKLASDMEIFLTQALEGDANVDPTVLAKGIQTLESALEETLA